MPLDTEVGLSPGDIVLDRDLAAPEKGHNASHFTFRPMEVDLSPDHTVSDGDLAPPPKRGTSAPPLLGPCLLLPNGCPSPTYTHHPASSPNYRVPVTGHRACSASLRLLQQRAVWPARFTDPASSSCTECHRAAHIRYTAFRAHLSCAHQPSLAVHP